jgi:hypothetical protein
MQSTDGIGKQPVGTVATAFMCDDRTERTRASTIERSASWIQAIEARTPSKPKETYMNLPHHDAGTHRLYCESKSGIRFDCRRISDDLIRELATVADAVVARVPNAKTSTPDKSIRALIDKLSDLSTAYRLPRDVQDLPPGRRVGQVAQLRRSVRLRTNRHPLIGTFDAWRNGKPQMLMAVVFAPLKVETCTLWTDLST